MRNDRFGFETAVSPGSVSAANSEQLGVSRADPTETEVALRRERLDVNWPIISTYQRRGLHPNEIDRQSSDWY
jgi:hypothetical protein